MSRERCLKNLVPIFSRIMSMRVQMRLEYRWTTHIALGGPPTDGTSTLFLRTRRTPDLVARVLS